MSYVWVCLDNKSAKMWGYTSFRYKDDTWTVHFYWGPVGRDISFLQGKEIPYSSSIEAQTAITKLIDDKERKGYKSMTNMQYFDLTRDYLLALEDILDPPEEENVPLKMKEALDEALV